MNPLSYFRGSVNGHNTVAGPHASKGGVINFNFNASNAAARATPPQSSQPLSTVPFPLDDDFVDRPRILDWMRERCARPATRIALVGLGGVGKSQLAIRYAHEVHLNPPRAHVFWVHASSRERFEEAYRSIAARLELPGRDDPKRDMLILVSEWLSDSRNGKWYMFIDNADDAGLFFSSTRPGLASFVPKTGHGTIVITSRSMDAAERLTGDHRNIFKVPVMETREAYQLLLEKLHDDNYDEEPAADLARALEYIPLAITQAAAYINRQAPRMTISTYLVEFEKNDSKKSNLLGVDLGDLRRDESASNSVITTWQMTFDQINRESPSAASLLCFMSFFNSQGIPESTLKAYANRHSRDNLNEDLGILRGYALVSITMNINIFEMHALVQFCTRVWLSSFDEPTRWKMEFLRVISTEYPDAYYDNGSACQELDPHIQGIIKEKPEDRIDSLFWANLLSKVSWYWLMRGRYSAAEGLRRQAVHAKKSICGDNHESTLASLSGLGVILAAQDKFEEAEQIHRQVHEGYANTLGIEARDTLRSTNDLASVLRSQYKSDEAKQIYQENMEAIRTVFGEDHEETLRSLNGLALTLVALGELDEAEQMHRQILDIRTQICGIEHPTTCASMFCLGKVLRDQGKYEEAEVIFQKCLHGDEKFQGADHPVTLQSRYTLALLLYKMSRLDDAFEQCEKAYEGYVRVFGEGHSRTSSCKELYCILLGERVL